MADQSLYQKTETSIMEDADVMWLQRNIAVAPADFRISWANFLSLIYPIGSVYISVVATNPNTLFGFGTWAAFGAGRALVGLDAGQTEFDVVEETGGAKTHTLTIAEMPSHSHAVPVSVAGSSAGHIQIGASPILDATSQNTGLSGGGTAHNNLQPYIVCYFWKRTA